MSRLFTAWAERMDTNAKKPAHVNGATVGGAGKEIPAKSSKEQNGQNAAPAASSPPMMAFMYTHQGRTLQADMTVEEAGIEDADEILAVELMDLTGPMPDDAVSRLWFYL